MQLWGWERSFFEELQSLLQTADRETSSANMAFCEYVVERIGMAIVSCSTLISQISNILPENEEESEAMQCAMDQCRGEHHVAFAL